MSLSEDVQSVIDGLKNSINSEGNVKLTTPAVHNFIKVLEPVRDALLSSQAKPKTGGEVAKPSTLEQEKEKRK